MQLVVMYVAPIPVGHRVRVVWHEEVQRGLVPGQERTDDRPHQPVLEDLDTGVIYASDWAFGAGRRKRPDQPYDVGQRPMADFRVAREITGRVAACRVITVRGYPELDVQTHLHIDHGE
ncbi:MAG: hypothetical protein H6736_23625 [Alphaproteobacteria bacterium]|nr:hypothetical protein [Alphaproteobacteria bacterium]